jgi:hypothetical protein
MTVHETTIGRQMSLMEFEYIYKWTSDLTVQEKHDWCFGLLDDPHYKPFWRDDPVGHFNHIFVSNPYGDSLHALVYEKGGGRLAARRALWRNDLGDARAFQPCETVVHSNFRRKGIFTAMTLGAMQVVGSAVFYNFPNNNSCPGYLKMGWVRRQGAYDYHLGTRNTITRHLDTTFWISDEYFKWMFANSKNKSLYCITQHNGKQYLLLRRRPKRIPFFVYWAVARLDDSVRSDLPYVRPAALLHFGKCPWSVRIHKKIANVVVNDRMHPYEGIVPWWKSDIL